MDEVWLSIVIPTYNESARIEATLDAILNFLGRQSYSSEIIIADDGSTDETASIAARKLVHHPHAILKNLENRGKGYVVRQGMLHAKGKHLLFTDADLSTPIEEVSRFMDFISLGYDVVIGSRALPESRIEIHQNFIRENMGRIFNRLARLVSFRGIRDSQCGFKCFKRHVAIDLFGRQKLDGFSFDAEILFLAQALGYRIYEAPVIWRNSPQTHVRAGDPIRMLIDLLRIRWLHRRL
ncbi:MAG: glycosyltransferase family 2 protein [Candidatus Omnitrophica bacterium]|nr:glycosyltransferase family 2 protein [Candidatus Omnitrophota bacterium]